MENKSLIAMAIVWIIIFQILWYLDSTGCLAMVLILGYVMGKVTEVAID